MKELENDLRILFVSKLIINLLLRSAVAEENITGEQDDKQEEYNPRVKPKYTFEYQAILGGPESYGLQE